MSYEQIGQIYDVLQDEVSYQQWYDLINRFKPNKSHVIWCDMACGTGTMLANVHDITHKIGVDLSSDMLTIAQQKNPNITFMQQNMSDFNLGCKVDYMTILCDSLNYLHTLEEVKATFELVFQHLNEGGILLFDVHTLQQIKQFAEDAVYHYDDGDLSYIWHCDEVQTGKIVHDLVFYQYSHDDLYYRIEEQHIEQTYDTATYQRLLTDIGFTIDMIFYDFDVHNQNEKTSSRLFIVCSKAHN